MEDSTNPKFLEFSESLRLHEWCAFRAVNQLAVVVQLVERNRG